jgi:Flp pilus assembly protein TadD
MAKITLARKYWDKAFDYYFDGESDRAIAAGRKAMKLNPALARPHWIVGQAFLFRRPPDRESAIKEFRQLVAKDPRWNEGHVALGAVLARQGRTRFRQTGRRWPMRATVGKMRPVWLCQKSWL